MQDPVNLNSFMLPVHLGGLKLVNSSDSETNQTIRHVEHSTMLRLIYVLDCSDGTKTDLAAVWETGALQVNLFSFTG